MRVIALAILAAAFAAAAPVPTPATSSVTFNKDVLPVLQRNCQTCHRPGEIAPMSLLDYKSTRPWAKAIKNAVLQGKMPPWFADPHYGKFSNDRRLPDADLKTLVAWVDAGAPEGNPKDAPAHPKWIDGWNIGKPDVEFSMPEPFNVPASGTIEYHYIVIPTGFAEDHWVQMSEVRPGNRALVHHANAYLRPPGSKWMASAKPGVVFVPTPGEKATGVPGRGEYELLASFTPGLQPWVCSPGAAKLVKAGSDIVLEIHYIARGAAAPDQTKIGLVFYKGQPERRELTMYTANSSFAIPPGNPAYEVKSEITLGQEAELVGMMPHMHLRGKDFLYRAEYPTGESSTLLNVPHYDFNWQIYYATEAPLVMPKGTRLRTIAHFDNSGNNPRNPDPTKEVRWGDQTWEEMMLGWFDFTIPAKTDPANLYHSKQGTSRLFSWPLFP